MNLEQIQAFSIDPVVEKFNWQSTALYALALGYGSDPLDEKQLGFVYENDMKAVPSLCNTLAHPGFWLRDPVLGIDWVKVLHAEQSFEIHKPLPVEGTLEAHYRITGVTDKGQDKGAVLGLEKLLLDVESNTLYATVTTTVFLRGDGGQGGFGQLPDTPDPIPSGSPDLAIDIQTLPQSALLYRLNGDHNPLHVDPAVARGAGFSRPILHGLATMGVATRAILEAACDHDPERLARMYVRFTQPVYPGETIRTEIYSTEPEIRFRCRVLERNVVVLERGLATLRSGSPS